MLQESNDRKVCTRRELESLIGSLNHACKVVRPGRSFLRQMLDLLHRANREDWNGVSVWKDHEQPTVEFASDASGSWGCGAWSGNQWLQFQWPNTARDLNIAVKELVPIILLGALWGRRWRGQKYDASATMRPSWW